MARVDLQVPSRHIASIIPSSRPSFIFGRAREGSPCEKPPLTWRRAIARWRRSAPSCGTSSQRARRTTFQCCCGWQRCSSVHMGLHVQIQRRRTSDEIRSEPPGTGAHARVGSLSMDPQDTGTSHRARSSNGGVRGARFTSCSVASALSSNRLATPRSARVTVSLFWAAVGASIIESVESCSSGFLRVGTRQRVMRIPSRSYRSSSVSAPKKGKLGEDLPEHDPWANAVFRDLLR